MAEQNEQINKNIYIYIYILSVKVVSVKMLMVRNTSNKTLDITDWASNLNHV